MNHSKPSPFALLTLIAAFVATASEENACTSRKAAANGDVNGAKACKALCSNHNDWRWDPGAQHRCNITRISRTELHRRFGMGGLPKLYPYPLVIYDEYKDPENEPRRNTVFAAKTTVENLPSCFPPDFNVTLLSLIHI